jgi:hypothetical protein
MKKMSVATMFALLVGLSCLGLASVHAAPPNDSIIPNGLTRKPLPNIVGSWKGTGNILAKDVDLDEIDVLINITKQSGSLFYGTMDVTLTHGDGGKSQKDFYNVYLWEHTSFSCPIAGNMEAKGDLTISGATVYEFPTYLPPFDPPSWMISSLKLDVMASLFAGNPRRIQGNFRVVVQPTMIYESPPPQVFDPPAAAFSGSFATHQEVPLL